MNRKTTVESALASPEMDAPWVSFRLDKETPGSLVEKIVEGISSMIEQGQLRVGAKLPSIRLFAKWYGISTFTVVEAYERLATTGQLSSRRGAGYFVAGRGVARPATMAGWPALAEIRPLVPDLYSGVTELLPVGSSWLPPEWHGEGLVIEAVRHAMRVPANRLRGYGHPQGFPSLRQHLASGLSKDLVEVEADQIVLTNGSTHAFDLILRALTQPGDTVLIENPGYANLPALVRQHHCVPIGIPRDESGLDLQALARCAHQYRPKLMFVGTVLQNPLGTSLSHAQAHQLLKLSADHDFCVVEGDTYREFASSSEPSLAAMDGLKRVIRVGSFSKTLSPTVRVGSIAAPKALVASLVQVKMLSGLTTSEINERAVYHAITTTAYRRMMDRLRSQLRAACGQALQTLTDFGLVPLARPRGGMFVSAGWVEPPSEGFNARVIANLALQSGILLSPDSFFTLGSSQSIWFRFNVAYAGAPKLAAFFQEHRQQLGWAHA